LVAAGRAAFSVLLCGQLPVLIRSVQSAHCTAQTYRVPTATGRTQLHWIALDCGQLPWIAPKKYKRPPAPNLPGIWMRLSPE
jgi:hypothetical protein